MNFNTANTNTKYEFLFAVYKKKRQKQVKVVKQRGLFIV